MFFLQGVYELTPTEITSTFAPILNTIDEIKDRLREEGKFILFYFRGQEQKTTESMKVLQKFVLLAKSKGLPAGQWNSQKNDEDEDIKDYFEEKYEIKDNMGIIMYRDLKYLTRLADICEEEKQEEKFKLFEKVLTEYSTWPVRPTPKEFRIAQEEKKAADAAAAKARAEECCIVL